MQNEVEKAIQDGLPDVHEHIMGTLNMDRYEKEDASVQERLDLKEEFIRDYKALLNYIKQRKRKNTEPLSNDFFDSLSDEFHERKERILDALKDE
jgi:hypothetical protein